MLSLRPTSHLSPADVDTMVAENLALVGHIVRETLGRVPAHVNRDDLTSAGLFALVVSAKTFDGSLGVPFARFAAIRIRGALMDELRSLDWASRSVRGRAREADAVRAQLAATLNRTPTSVEVGAALGLSPAEVSAVERDVQRAALMSLEGFAPGCGPALVSDAARGPEELLLHRDQIGLLHDAIAELPERLRTVIERYFFAGDRMNEIAADLGVSESRISQMRAEALAMLRSGLNGPDAVSAIGGSRRVARASAYATAVHARGTTATRLAVTTPLGDVIAG